MRKSVINRRNDLQGLSARPLRKKAGSKGALDSLKKHNPLVEPSTARLVPEVSGFRDAESAPVEGETFDALRKEMLASMDAAIARAHSGYEALDEQRQEVTAALRTAALKRALETDPDLKAQVDAAAEVFKQDQAQAKAAEETLKAMRQEMDAELAGLAKLLA